MHRGTKQNPHYSSAYTCDNNDSSGRCIMNYAICIWPKYGIDVHEWSGLATYQANGGYTHGCIHVQHKDAEDIYNWFDCRTHLLVSYPWPVREF